ncbi:polysaccharide deacetylase family protein [Methylobacterium sp. NEAU 140]|uniref:polysaccharide deacetylase family protein n=1 Tax=Methylobacterium sp. NEAU 140 TaxID=3064945 RepID=UPI002736A33A|nr:polysaccharide deacetylase family protein [Methylobacterium sp. NEAU 140]MDP4023754.1 polysaccharide deacetylase family protein [Methylobacterium sp. NEAU 140]
MTRANAVATDRDARDSISLPGKFSNLLARHYREATIQIPSNATMVSFTFDDIPECAATIGAALLEEHGYRGTFYISSGLAGTRNTYWTHADHRCIAELARRGHEIGCHTLDHPIMTGLSSEAASRAIETNRHALRDRAGIEKLETFAYPFGYASVGVKRIVGRNFLVGRGVHCGINRGASDRCLLRAVPLTVQSFDDSTVSRSLSNLAMGGGWLIFYTHDVRTNPSPYGCTPEMLDRTIEAIRSLRISCKPVVRALADWAPDRSHRNPLPDLAS